MYIFFLEILDEKLLGKSPSLPALNARGTSHRSEKRKSDSPARKATKNASRSTSRSTDRLPKASPQSTKKKYPSIIVKEASTDEQTAITLLKKYDEIRADLDKKMEQISLNSGK